MNPYGILYSCGYSTYDMPQGEARLNNRRPSCSECPKKSEVTIKMTASAWAVAALLWAIVTIWPRGCSAALIKDQSIELIINSAAPAALINIHEPQRQLFSVSEFYSLSSLQSVKKNLASVMKHANKLGRPTRVPLNEARDFCPLLGGREMQHDPLLGPHPAYLPNPAKSMSPIDIFTKTRGNTSFCAYTVSDFILSSLEQTFANYHYNQQANSWLNYKQLLSPHCPDGSYGRGEIQENYQRIVFPHRRSYNLILCGEQCRNSFEMASINCSAPLDQDWGELGCGTEGCRTYSYNPETKECRLSPEHKPDFNEEWYGPLGEKGGITAIWVKVRCQSSLLLPDVQLRAPRSLANEKEFPLWSARAACIFDPLVHPTFRVYTRCTTAQSATKILLSPTISKIDDLSNRMRRQMGSNNFRVKRASSFTKGLGAAGPHIVSFLSQHMLQVAPKFAHIPAVGPTLGILLGLAGSLLPLITHIAYQTQSDDNYPVSSGSFIMQKKNSHSSSQNWTQKEDIMKLDYRSPVSYDVSLTTWIQSVVEQAMIVEKSVSEILSDPRPRHKKIRKQLQKFSEMNYVTFYSSPNLIRRQYYWSAPVSSGNPITNQALVSLNSDLPLMEGWRSSVSLSSATGLGPVSYHCTAHFSDEGPLPKECFDSSRLGSPTESVLPASTKYLVLKVLGKQKIIQILCGGNFLPATFATKGTFLAIVGRNCDAFSEGGLLIRAEEGKMSLGYKVLINAGPKLINHTIPLANVIKNQILNYTSVSSYSTILLSLWLLAVTLLLLYCTCCKSKFIPCDDSIDLSSGLQQQNNMLPHSLANPTKPGPSENEEGQQPPPMPLWRGHPEYKGYRSSKTSAALL